MYNTRGWMGGAWAFQTVCAMPSRIQKCLFIVSLKALSCSFPDGVTSVSIGGLILHRWAFFFPFFSLSFLKKLQFGSTSILALLISIFWSRPFCRYFIGYWFRHNINLPKIIFFYVVLIVWISNFFLGSF